MLLGAYVVTDNGEGELEATVNLIGGPVSFTNTYEAAPDSVVFKAEKILEGQVLGNREFSFELVDDSGSVIQTAKNNNKGQIIFEEITYEAVGIHTYTIREVAGIQGGITYSISEFEVTVVVTDDGEGQLTATETYDNEELKFTNIYHPTPENTAIEANKVLGGLELQDEQFTFELVDNNGVVLQTKENNADGQIIFDEMTFESAGEYHYTIREVEGTQGGITYDETEFNVVVSVMDDREGTLTVKVDYVDGPVEFNNVYVPAPDSVVFEASKLLEGQELRAGQFEFELVDADGTVLQTKENNANGQVIFDEMTYDVVGEHTYTVREVEGTQGGITYDSNVFEIKVSVEDNLEGNLVAETVYVTNEPIFTNIYETAPDSVVFEAEKILNGRDLENNEFKFELADSDGNVIQTVTNNANGQIYFNEIQYEEAGEYVYSIREVTGTEETITYDESEFSVVVTVTDDGEGQLTAMAQYVDGTAVFENTYTEPVVPIIPGGPVDPETPAEDKSGDLPAAGESVTNILLGFALLVLGGLLVLYDRRKTRN